ncbi:MAG: serine hydrolase [Phycisphaerae bacterium]|nr:serine hydrolase [Phycisphaerae bacterium]
MNSTVSRWLVGVVCALGVAAVNADDDVIVKARQLVDAGQFAAAEKLLSEHISNAEAPVTEPAAIELEIIRRIRLDYCLSADEILARVRAETPDATADDVTRWTKEDVLQHRMIDGQPRYFSRAVGTLFKLSKEARKRRQLPPEPAGDTFDMPLLIERILHLADKSDSPFVAPVKHHVRYTLTVKEGNKYVHAGAKVRCWLPFPQRYRQQREVRLISTDPPGAVVAPEGTPQRTVYFEQTIEDPKQPPRFVAEFEFITCAYVPDINDAEALTYDTSSNLYREFTAERPPHIVFTPEVGSLVQEIVGVETHPLRKARAIFRWVDENIPWYAEMEYSTIRNISAKALTARRGDCGVQGLTFITLCRAAGIPARWQSGWQTKPGEWNMHDWSEFYVEPWGWLPADASNGLQKHADPRVQEFFCGHMDPYRMIVNLDYGQDLVPPKTSFRSEPYDFQRGEIEIDGHNLYFNEWSWDFDLKTVPLDGGMRCLEEALDAVVPDELKAGKIPGAVIVVGRKTADGFQQWQKVYGYRCTEPKPATMTADAVFDLASMTKPIATGTSMAVLLEQGRVKLDDPVASYLPEFDTPEKKGVTIHHLMTHTSGMPPYVGAAQQKPIKEANGFPCPDAIRAYIHKLDLQRPPGEAVIYSCLNAILCAEIVEAVSGQPIDKFAAEHVFGPLKMTDTGYNPPEKLWPRCLTTTQTDYGRGEGGFLQGQVHDPLAAMQAGVSGNAGLFSTAQDLGRFAQMMLNGGELDGVRVLKPETISEMTRVQNAGKKNLNGVEDRRGLLWDLYVPDADDTGVDKLFAYGHTGYTGTAIRIYPEQGVYIIALTNRVHPDDTGKVADFRQAIWQAVGDILMDAAK